MNAVVVNQLRKKFKTLVPSKGSIYQKVKNYIFPKYETLNAVDDISFQIKKGECVAFIGPNGAGKSTTIKMLAGIMEPTSGHIEVLGKIPARSRTCLSYQISAMFGNNSKLMSHLPIQETYTLFAAIYDIPMPDYKRRLNDLVECFSIGHLLSKSPRQLSLGERMKCELVANFIHNPKVVFLDEPTIGLDITAKETIRALLRKRYQEEQTTLLLTSHDTDDIERVCNRVILIDKGHLILDATLSDLKMRYKKKVVMVITEEDIVDWNQQGSKVVESSPHHTRIEVDLEKSSIERVIGILLKNYNVKDLTVESPSLETIINNLYKYGTNAE